MIELIISQIIIINSFSFGGAPAAGGSGSILQEDGFLLMQQDGTSKLVKEFTPSGNILQEDSTFLLQQDGTSKLQKQ